MANTTTTYIISILGFIALGIIQLTSSNTATCDEVVSSHLDAAIQTNQTLQVTPSNIECLTNATEFTPVKTTDGVVLTIEGIEFIVDHYDYEAFKQGLI